MYKNRIEAAKLLARKLKAYEDKNVLVLAIPRGAVPMGKVIADILKGELNIVLVHKIPMPYNEELAIGSIGLSGQIQIMPYAKSFGIQDTYLKEEAERQLKILKSRQRQYGIKDPNYFDRPVIIVDDGIATGSTVLSAINEIRGYHPKKIIVAAAVASQESAEKVREEADELITLEEPVSFMAVGQFFENFEQVSDEEVVSLLKSS